MSITKVRVEEFLELASKHAVLDVRSPGEHNHAHIPGAISFPLFTDEERKVVGTKYKQQSREDAIKIGLDYFGVKMRTMVEDAERLVGGKTVLLHCWRGGMRSAAVAWLLDIYGFKVYLLIGGYKAYRHWVIDQFEKDLRLQIVGGFTGSGKTEVLNELRKQGQAVIDLEDIAKHKGSAFGDLEGISQPKQEMFENLLATEIANFQAASTVWLEDESQRIGLINIPQSFWKRMRCAPVYFLEIPFEVRLDYIIRGYGKINKGVLLDAITRIQKRLGGLDTKNAIQYLSEDNLKDCFRILLKYYDKHYAKGLDNRENLAGLLQKVTCNKADAMANVSIIQSLAATV